VDYIWERFMATAITPSSQEAVAEVVRRIKREGHQQKN
jgi:hypothetical protein